MGSTVVVSRGPHSVFGDNILSYLDNQRLCTVSVTVAPLARSAVAVTRNVMTPTFLATKVKVTLPAALRLTCDAQMTSLWSDLDCLYRSL